MVLSKVKHASSITECGQNCEKCATKTVIEHNHIHLKTVIQSTVTHQIGYVFIDSNHFREWMLLDFEIVQRFDLGQV